MIESYKKIIEAYDPYYQPEGDEINLSPEGMIYNLTEIENDLNPEEVELKEAISNFKKSYAIT